MYALFYKINEFLKKACENSFSFKLNKNFIILEGSVFVATNCDFHKEKNIF